jgi:hypothetical protein
VTDDERWSSTLGFTFKANDEIKPNLMKVLG